MEVYRMTKKKEKIPWQANPKITITIDNPLDTSIRKWLGKIREWFKRAI